MSACPVTISGQLEALVCRRHDVAGWADKRVCNRRHTSAFPVASRATLGATTLRPDCCIDAVFPALEQALGASCGEQGRQRHTGRRHNMPREPTVISLVRSNKRFLHFDQISMSMTCLCWALVASSVASPDTHGIHVMLYGLSLLDACTRTGMKVKKPEYWAIAARIQPCLSRQGGWLPCLSRQGGWLPCLSRQGGCAGKSRTRVCSFVFLYLTFTFEVTFAFMNHFQHARP